MGKAVIEFRDVSVTRDGTAALSELNWTVEPDQRWVVLGPNGAGKSTLLQIAAGTLHPSAGKARVLGEKLGETDLFALRPRIGFAASSLARKLPRKETVLNVVLTAAYAVTGRWHEKYDDIDIRRAHRVLSEWNLDELHERRFGSLSDGEQKRAQIARAVMTDPELLLLDEPAASLDLGAREELIALLSGYAESPTAPAMVMVTHHVEEIPRGFTHALLLRAGRLVAAGDLATTLTEENIARAFGVSVALGYHNGRFVAQAR